ncbi:hypothetical protein [Microcoleus sp. bin38.metabat.b11b12b14.051]|uniref:hypothetical protein n=1 Tax=Microcoleus sp. bin38.metabat.b11b12b14.051 TaxID=2742709 RepID=UPI0025E568D6|nr:hypothetical protein [Microcoleus sp. bin38.metabat.b11b12b14.051]
MKNTPQGCWRCLSIANKRHKERSTAKYAIATTSPIDRAIVSQSQAAQIISNPPQNPRFLPTGSNPRYSHKNPRLRVNVAKYFDTVFSGVGQASFDLFSSAIDYATPVLTSKLATAFLNS